MSNKLLAPLVLTCGEPAGIGIEIAAKGWAALHHDASKCFFLICDTKDFEARTRLANCSVPFEKIDHPQDAQKIFGTALPILHRSFAARSQPGVIALENSPMVIEMIAEAARLCMAGKASGLVTCPINKDALYSAGFKYQGHTDFLAGVAREDGLQAHDVMMLVGGGLRAIPVTVHIPLANVPAALTTSAIVEQGKIVAASLTRYFGVASPRLAVTGLNPHAGENGAMGKEDQTIVAPAVAALRAAGIAVQGPLPADTAFHAEARAGYDAILCMYHDQALIPVKTLDFHGGINVTLGLPFIRTSPDHGTAFGLAGKGTARADSLIAAINLAAEMASTDVAIRA
jgi:4-hydroxythreonine-4-phosphate dehydrogenase